MKYYLVKSLIFVLVIAVIFSLCGCVIDSPNHTLNSTEETSMDTHINHSDVNLTIRQKKILTDKGLSTDYSKLTATQQAAIVAIEDMLLAVENKYNLSFEFVSYTAKSLLDEEQLVAYPTGGDPSLDKFTVTKLEEDGKVVYTDGYANLAAKQVFNAFIVNYCQSQLGVNSVKVYSLVSNIKIDTFPLSIELIPNNVDGDNWIFIDCEAVSEGKYNQFIQDFSGWLSENGIAGTNQIILLNAGELKLLTQYNYSTYLSQEHWVRREYINK